MVSLAVEHEISKDFIKLCLWSGQWAEYKSESSSSEDVSIVSHPRFTSQIILYSSYNILCDAAEMKIAQDKKQ